MCVALVVATIVICLLVDWGIQRRRRSKNDSAEQINQSGH